MAARISGVTIPDQKQVWVALTYVYGIGPKSAHDILAGANVEATTRAKDLTDAEIGRIQGRGIGARSRVQNLLLEIGAS